MLTRLQKTSPDPVGDQQLDLMNSEPLPTPAPSPTPAFYSRMHHHHSRRNRPMFPIGQLSSKLKESIDYLYDEDDDLSDVSEERHDPDSVKHVTPGSHLAYQVQDQFMDLSESEKAEFIRRLLNHTGREVLVRVFDYVSPKLKRDPFTVFPNEISLRILSYIDDPVTLARASQVSKLWYLVLSDDLTWKELCRKHHFRRLSAAVNVSHAGIAPRAPSITSNVSLAGIPKLDTSELTEAIYDPNATKRPVPTSYRSHFKQQYLLNSSWASGGRLAAKYVMANPGVVTALIMEDPYIVIALDCSKIFVFREDGKMLRSLFGHVMGVWALTSRGDTLVSGGCDRDVRVWDLKTGNCTQILKGHSSTVRCLQMADDNTAVSGSRDSTIRVWDAKRGECKMVLEGHRSSVRCIKVVGDICVSGSYDFTAKVWRISTGELLHTLAGHYSQIYSLAFDGYRVVTGSLDAAIRIWNPYTGECLATLQGHTSLVGHLQMKDDVLVSGGSDGVIRIWDLKSYTCVERYAAHDNSVSSLCFEDGRIVSGGTDGKVRIWESNNGHIRDLAGQFETVWCVAAKDEKLVILASKNQHIYMELMSFTPPAEKYEQSSTEFIPNEGLMLSPNGSSSDVKLDNYIDPKDSLDPKDPHDLLHTTRHLRSSVLGDDVAMDLSN